MRPLEQSNLASWGKSNLILFSTFTLLLILLLYKPHQCPMLSGYEDVLLIIYDCLVLLVHLVLSPTY